MFRWFRRLVEVVERLAQSVEDLAGVQRSAGPAVDRLEALELSRHHFEAEVQGMLLKAEGKLKAASNAEARERQLKKSHESRLDSFPPDSQGGDEEEHPVLPDDVAAGEAERLHSLRLGVAPNDKAHAVMAKWQMTSGR